MNFRQIDKSPETFILVFKTGDEPAKDLLNFAKDQKLSAANFKAVGTLSSVRLGWFSCSSPRSAAHRSPSALVHLDDTPKPA